MSARPMLRDAVERRQRFEPAHPEVTITVPGTRSGWWIAAVPPGSVPGDPERAKVTAWQLADLMDALERIWPPDELGMELRADWGRPERAVTGPARRLAPDDGDQVVRLARFRAAHPDVDVAAGEFGTWQARIPEENGETIITRHLLGELLDRLGEVTGQRNGQPGSGPG